MNLRKVTQEASRRYRVLPWPHQRREQLWTRAQMQQRSDDLYAMAREACRFAGKMPVTDALTLDEVRRLDRER